MVRGASEEYLRHRGQGHGVTWANSLFEDNAEHGLGLEIGQKYLRDGLIAKVKELAEVTTNPNKKAACEEYLATLDDGEANATAAAVLIAELQKDPECQYSKEILGKKEYLAKKSVWIFGGDGWAYDIGFGGLDHVLASGEDVNVMLIGVEDEKVDEVIGIIAEHSKQRKEIVPSTASYGIGVTTAFPLEVTVGGATVFVTNVERFEKL